MSNKETIKTMKCPFDPSHVMPYQRFLNHLEKCKFPDKKSYRKCKFNPYHVEHMNQIARHQAKCKDQKKYEKQEEDDWGLPAQPEEMQKKQKSMYSLSTSQRSYSTSQKTQLSSSVSGSSNSSKKKDVNKNSSMYAMDLDQFNPVQNSQRQNQKGKEVNYKKKISNPHFEAGDLSDYNFD